MIVTYRKIEGSDTWHWMNCSHIRDRKKEVLISLDMRNSRPSHGELCNECLSLERKEKEND